MEDFLFLLYKFTGGIYIPKELKTCKESLLVHISDTPICFFDALSALLKKMKPKYIVHTGDVVDNIKLEFSSSLLPRYRKDARKLIDILETSTAEYIYITLGNHDDLTTLENLSMKSIIVPKSEIITAEGLEFNISHYSSLLVTEPSCYNLFGHDLNIQTGAIDGNMFLNGIMNINVVTLSSGRVFKLYYPFGTDDMRLKKTKIGL